MSYDKENGPFNSTIFVTPRSHFKPIVLNNGDRNTNDENEEVQMLFKKEDELNKTKSILNSIREERDLLRRKIKELNDEIKLLQAKNSELHHRRLSDGNISNKFSGENKKSIAKLAGKVKLKRTSKNCDGEIKEIYGKDLQNKQISSSVAEQLISTLRESSNVQEIINEARNSEIQPLKLQKQFEIELELSHCERDHVKSENNLLQLTLQEIKERYENIQLMFEKCEANNSAYQMALDYSEIGFSLCKILLGKYKSSNNNYNKSPNGSISNEQFYNQLINCVPMLINSHMTKNVDPRETMKAVHELTHKLSWERLPSNTKNESMLHHSIQSILSQIQIIRQTCAPVKTSSTEKLDYKPSSPNAKKPVNQSDFENAVLLNELTAVKKEFAEYKMQYHMQESRNEKRAIKKYGTLTQNATQSKPVIKNEKSPTSDLESSSSADTKIMSLADLRITQLTECEMGIELSQALQREKKLEGHIESLANTLERLQKNSELRHTGSQQVLEQFKHSYSALVNNMKRLRDKHNIETSLLKQNISDMTTRHNHVVMRLKEELLVLERENENKILPDNETAL